MGCGIGHFGRRGLETTQTDKICPQGFELVAQLGFGLTVVGVSTRGATETPLRRESKPLGTRFQNFLWTIPLKGNHKDDWFKPDIAIVGILDISFLNVYWALVSP